MENKKLVVHISRSSLAGAPIRIVNAINEHTEFQARLINTNPACYGARTFPEDLIWGNEKEACLDLIRKADIIHFHHYTDLKNNFFDIDFTKEVKNDCKFLRHYHSNLNALSNYDKKRAEEFLQDPINRVVIPHCPERTFLDTFILPNIMPINDENMRPKETKNSKVKVLFSASNKASRYADRWETKGYPQVSKKLKYLSKKFDFEYIELCGVPFEEAMEIKQSADIIIGDVVTGSYHLTELEALSQGKVVITYLDARSVMTLMNITSCKDIPFVNSNIDELENVLKELVNNEKLREDISCFSRSWIEEYYDDKLLIQKYSDVYNKILKAEDIKREGYDKFTLAKEFLYNGVFDIKWNGKVKHRKDYALIRKVERFYNKMRMKILKSIKNYFKNIVNNFFVIINVPINYKKYWMNDRLDNVIPLNHGDNPEGFDPKDILKQITENLDYDKVLDFGCGYGRLSAAFPSCKYLGIDLNPEALAKAKKLNPEHSYQETYVDSDDYPSSDLTIAYTVFLHLDDKTLDNIMSKLSKSTSKYFVIAEILGREWANMGKSLPPTYNREKEHYCSFMQSHNFNLINEVSLPYLRYVNDKKYADKKNKTISFLLFEKKGLQ